MPTERVLPASQGQDDVSEVEEPVKVLEVQGTFDEMMVWGHEILPAADDTFVKGVEEWVRFAEAVGAFSEDIDDHGNTTDIDDRCMGPRCQLYRREKRKKFSFDPWPLL